MASPNLCFRFNFSTFFLFVILLVAKPIFSFSSPDFKDSNPSSAIYDVLDSHGLPIGLFPKGISNFSMDPISGRFEFHLTKSPCDAEFETHVRYDWNVSGTISYGQIAGLCGVAAQDLFLWFPVKDVRVDIPSSGLIYFDVGVVSKQFSLSFFETPQDCTLAEDDDRYEKLSLPVDLAFLEGRGRIVENQSEEPLEKGFEGHARRAVS